MANFEDYPKNFLLAGLFVICMITFAVMLGNNYGQSEALMKSDQIDFSKLENQINQTSSDAQKWERHLSPTTYLLQPELLSYSLFGELAN